MNLYLFTENYPFGKGEDYVHNELKIIAKAFKTIYLIPCINNDVSKQTRILPTNCQIIKIPHPKKIQKIALLVVNALMWINLILSEIKDNKNRIKIIKKLTLYVDLSLINIFRYKQVKKHIYENKDEHNICYSFWMNDGVTVLGLLKKNRKIDSSFCRVNGYDFREEMAPDGFIFPRQFQLKHISRVYAVSKHALKTIKHNYPKYAHKFHLSYLGVYEMGNNPPDPLEKFHVISCSNLTEIKRVDLIIEMLAYLKHPIHWIHFGGGPDYQKLLTKAGDLPQNITWEIRGTTPNQLILDHYKTTHVDLFIQLSLTEGGVPVSMQEAASFGIPLLGTNAGGIPEIINKNGWLVDVQASAAEIAKRVEDVILHKEKLLNKRINSKKHYAQNFNAENNYKFFLKQILNQHGEK